MATGKWHFLSFSALTRKFAQRGLKQTHPVSLGETEGFHQARYRTSWRSGHLRSRCLRSLIWPKGPVTLASFLAICFTISLRHCETSCTKRILVNPLKWTYLLNCLFQLALRINFFVHRVTHSYGKNIAKHVHFKGVTLGSFSSKFSDNKIIR